MYAHDRYYKCCKQFNNSSVTYIYDIYEHKHMIRLTRYGALCRLQFRNLPKLNNAEHAEWERVRTGTCGALKIKQEHVRNVEPRQKHQKHTRQRQTNATGNAHERNTTRNIQIISFLKTSYQYRKCGQASIPN